MSLSVSVSLSFFRQDSSILPVITAGDVSNQAFVKISDWLYLRMDAANLTFVPPNRTLNPVPVVLRDLFFPAFTLDAGVISSGGALERTSGEGYNGAYYNTPLNATKCSVQGKATSTQYSCGISLQDSDEAISHNYGVATVAHSITLGQDGQGSIRELGLLAKNNATFKYEVGDTAMIELDGTVVRYFLIKENGTMKTLRTTRSKLTAEPVAEVMLYFTGSNLRNIFVNDNASASTSFENIGVAYYERVDGKERKVVWQKWGNARTTQPIGDALEMADKRTQFTYPNQKTVLHALNLTPKSYGKKAFLKMIDFVKWHKNDTEFIFIDYARRDEEGNPSEYWARFQGAFSDSPINACIFEEGVQIIEDFRNDYIPALKDTVLPNVSVESVEDNPFVLNVTGFASDNILLVSLQLFLNNKAYGDPFLTETPTSEEWGALIQKDDLEPGINTIFVIATDYGGNERQSNTMTYDAEAIPPEIELIDAEMVGLDYVISGTADDNSGSCELQLYHNDDAVGDPVSHAGGAFELSILNTDLIEGHNTFYVIATDPIGNFTISNTLDRVINIDTIPPDIPTGLTASTDFATSIFIEWEMPSDTEPYGDDGGDSYYGA